MLPKPLVAASLEPIVLSLLSEKAMYGYEILKHVETLSDGQITWTTNKLYPLLHHLEHQRVVEPFWQPSESGPDRKYYRLTVKGEKALDYTKQNWLTLNRILVKLWGPDLSLSPSM